MSRKFITFPIPKYLRTAKRASPVAVNKPLRALIKSVDAVKKIAVKNITKKIKTIPDLTGSVK